jgi:hypothetical protein
MVLRRRFGLFALLFGLMAPAAARAAAPLPAGTSSYETLAQGAARTHDVATLLAAFVDHCDTEKRDLDRARCRAATAFLRRTLPGRTFSFQTDEPSTISVSDYDAAVKGYHLSLAGCIACTKPIELSGGPRFVTLKTPDKEGETLSKAVALSRNTFGFDSLVEAKRWLEKARPFLRAEFLFRPTAKGKDASWTYGVSQGVALDLVGARVFNRCTGEVLVSAPPSTAPAPRPASAQEDPSCAGAIASGTAVATAPAPEDAPAQLTKAAIADAMAKIRPQVFGCYQQFQVPGRIELTYVVASNGTVQSVAVGPAFAGTPTGMCVQEAGKNARFPMFKLERQKFTYPFFLRQ